MEKSETSFTLVNMARNDSNNSEIVIFQIMEPDFSVVYLGIEYLPSTTVNEMKIKKFIQSEEIDDLKVILNLNQLKEVTVCPHLQQDFVNSYTNFMHENVQKYNKQKQENREYKYKAFDYNKDAIKNGLSKNVSTNQLKAEQKRRLQELDEYLDAYNDRPRRLLLTRDHF